MNNILFMYGIIPILQYRMFCKVPLQIFTLCPSHMLAPKKNRYRLRLLSLIGNSRKRDIAQSIMYEIYSCHLHLENKLCAKYIDPCKKWLSRYFVHNVPYGQKSEKGHNSVKYSQNFTKHLSGHLHHVP